MYTPNEWKNGDLITAEKLNHAEDGIKNAYDPVVVKFSRVGHNLEADKTYDEVKTAYKNGTPILGFVDYGDGKSETLTLDGLLNEDEDLEKLQFSHISVDGNGVDGRLFVVKVGFYKNSLNDRDQDYYDFAKT